MYRRNAEHHILESNTALGSCYLVDSALLIPAVTVGGGRLRIRGSRGDPARV
jgi:hypothetical protein